MNPQLMIVLMSLGALALGGAIGFAFGAVQHAAFLRHRNLQQGDSFRTGWSVMPGSMRRVAYLLVALTAVQIACPFFFDQGAVKWLVSAGVVIGYGASMLKSRRWKTVS